MLGIKHLYNTCSAKEASRRSSCQGLAVAPRREGASAKKSSTCTRAGGEETGWKWDGSNLRWVRDDRYIGVPQQTMITPKSGTPYTVWPVVYSTLVSKKLRGVPAPEAAKMAQQGWRILDVRLEGDFENGHCEGSTNVSLFRYTAGNELWDKIKKVAMAGFAMQATERDPDFADNVLAMGIKKNQKLIVCCAIGGTLDSKLRLRPDKYPNGINDLDRSFGRESRSLKACYELFKAGWNTNNLVFMEGGVQQWKFQGFPME